MQIARFQPGELRQIVCLDVFDVMARLAQHLAHQLRCDQLPGPVVQRQPDRIGRVLAVGHGTCGQSDGHGGKPGESRHDAPPAGFGISGMICRT
jgi:hypothetical protein